MVFVLIQENSFVLKLAIVKYLVWCVLQKNGSNNFLNITVCLRDRSYEIGMFLCGNHWGF